MKPRTRTELIELLDWWRHSYLHHKRLSGILERCDDAFPGEFADLEVAAREWQNRFEQMPEQVKRLLNADENSTPADSEPGLTADEVRRLLDFNRFLKEVGSQIRTAVEDIKPRLDFKDADPDDPLWDYELEIKLYYILREDDPEYAEDDDNFLTKREEVWIDPDDFNPAFDCPSHWPEALRAEPHCWLFYDLYENGYGPEFPKLSLKDCLRVGKVWVDVQAWQQYMFAIPPPAGKSGQLP